MTCCTVKIGLRLFTILGCFPLLLIRRSSTSQGLMKCSSMWHKVNHNPRVPHTPLTPVFVTLCWHMLTLTSPHRIKAVGPGAGYSVVD
jgi:hypothetical protein